MRLWPAVLLCAACSAFRGEARPTVPDEEARQRAALVTLVVDNRTSHELTIGYRTPNPPIQQVTIGSIAAAARRAIAPIPGGEPLVLIARRDDGAAFTLPARSFPLEGEWVWSIPVTAEFVK